MIYSIIVEAIHENSEVFRIDEPKLLHSGSFRKQKHTMCRGTLCTNQIRKLSSEGPEGLVLPVVSKKPYHLPEEITKVYLKKRMIDDMPILGMRFVKAGSKLSSFLFSVLFIFQDFHVNLIMPLIVHEQAPGSSAEFSEAAFLIYMNSARVPRVNLQHDVS